MEHGPAHPTHPSFHKLFIQPNQRRHSKTASLPRGPAGQHIEKQRRRPLSSAVQRRSVIVFIWTWDEPSSTGLHGLFPGGADGTDRLRSLRHGPGHPDDRRFAPPDRSLSGDLLHRSVCWLLGPDDRWLSSTCLFCCWIVFVRSTAADRWASSGDPAVWQHSDCPPDTTDRQQ